MTAQQRVTRGFAWNQLYKLVEYGGVNLYAILVVRTFGPELGGNYAVYLSITGTLGILAAFAVDGILLRYLPRVSRGEYEYGSMKYEGMRPFLLHLFAFRVLVTIVLSALVAVVLGVLPHWIPSLSGTLGNIQVVWPYVIIFLIGQCAVAFGTFTLIGLLQVKWVFYASLLTRVLLLALGFGMIFYARLTLTSAVAVHACATLLNGALLLYWVYRHVEHTSKAGLRNEFRSFTRHVIDFVRKPRYLQMFLVLPFMLYGITTWGSDVLTTILGRQPDILMMRAMLGENTPDIGLYEAAARIVLVTEYVFLFGLSGTLVTVFSELAHQDESNPQGGRRYARLFQARRDICGFQSVSTAPLIAFMIAFAPLVMQIIYGTRFSGSVPLIMVGLCALAVTVIGFGGGMQITSLVTIGKERVVFKNRLAWGVLNLIVNYFLIQHFGGLGAMIGTQLSNSGACITESIFAHRLIGPSFQFARTLSIVLIAAISAAVSYVIAIVWMPDSMIPLVRVLVGGVVMGILTLSAYIAFRIPEAQTVFQKLRGLVGKEEKMLVRSVQ